MANQRITAVIALMLCSAPYASVFASLPAVGAEVAQVTAQDFKALAAAGVPGLLHHGGKRALLQSSGFDQSFFNVLEPILVGDTGDLHLSSFLQIRPEVS